MDIEMVLSERLMILSRIEKVIHRLLPDEARFRRGPFQKNVLKEAQLPAYGPYIGFVNEVMGDLGWAEIRIHGTRFYRRKNYERPNYKRKAIYGTNFSY